MVTRRGLGHGRGMGYKNIIPKYDSHRHALNAKGYKMPQHIGLLHGGKDMPVQELKTEEDIDKFLTQNQDKLKKIDDAIEKGIIQEITTKQNQKGGVAGVCSDSILYNLQSESCWKAFAEAGNQPLFPSGTFVPTITVLSGLVAAGFLLNFGNKSFKYFILKRVSAKNAKFKKIFQSAIKKEIGKGKSEYAARNKVVENIKNNRYYYGKW